MEQTTTKQVYELLLNSIENGTYPYGHPIPSERVLAGSYFTSRTVIRKAIDMLADQGLLYRIPGKGTYVSLPRLNASNSIISTRKYLDENGISSKTKLIYSGVRKADYKYSQIFKIDPSAEIYQLYRLRLGNDTPYAIEYAHIPLELFPDIASHDFTKASLYQYFDDCHMQIAFMHQTLDLVRVCGPQASLLAVDENSSAFMRKNYVYNNFNRVIEYTLSYSVADKYSFKIY